MALRSRLIARREFLGLSQKRLAHMVGAGVSSVRRWENGGNLRSYQRRQLADALKVPLEPTPDEHSLDWYLVCDDETVPVAASRQSNATVVGDAGGAGTERRDALKLGLMSAVAAPEVLGRVLREAAAETAEFTRRAAASSVGQGALDHLQLVVADISAAYSRGSPQEVFAVAHTYRRQVDDLLGGPHTLAEAGELYMYAAWLSETLAWVTHDLGSPLAADAYCVDTFEHAQQVGHDELCTWAMDARASIAMYDHRPADALQAALRGIETAPQGHPLAVRMHAQAARASARLGRRDDFEQAFAAALDLYDQLPASPPTRFGKGTAKLAAYAITSYAATAYLWLGMFDKARAHAENALQEHRSAVERDRSPSREAIAQLDLAAALTGLGEPEEAARLGTDALSSQRVVDSVLVRADDLGGMMLGRYPQLPATHDFRDSLHTLNRPQAELPT